MMKFGYAKGSLNSELLLTFDDAGLDAFLDTLSRAKREGHALLVSGGGGLGEFDHEESDDIVGLVTIRVNDSA